MTGAMFVTYVLHGLSLKQHCCIVKTPGRHTIGASHGWVAQLAEQWTENPRVAGSIPAPAILQMKYDWREAGEEWSQPWGNSAAQWAGTIFPRIRECLPAGTTLEIAPGFGRWTHYLKD